MTKETTKKVNAKNANAKNTTISKSVSNNDKYAVVRINGKQHIVHDGEELLIDKLDPKEIKPEVLLLVNADKVEVGKPVLEKAKVTFKVLAQEEKGKKLHVFKYKAKSRYRKKVGFRPQYTRLLIEKVY